MKFLYVNRVVQVLKVVTW